MIFVEDIYRQVPVDFERRLTSLSQQPGFELVRALLIGRFQADILMTRAKLQHIVDSNHLLAELPIVANLDFGHTNPMLTIPVGGNASVTAVHKHCVLEFD